MMDELKLVFINKFKRWIYLLGINIHQDLDMLKIIKHVIEAEEIMTDKDKRLFIDFLKSQ